MEQVEMVTRSRIPLQIPLSVRRAWGDEATDAFTEWMEVAVLPHMASRDEHREILSRMDVLESRMDSLERAVLQNRLEFHQRLDGLRAEFKEELGGLRAEFKEELREHRRETRIMFDDLRREMDERFDRMDERFDRMNERFDRMYERMLVQTRWMIGSLTVIGALVTLLLTVGMFVQ